MYRDLALHLLEQGYQPIPIKPGTKRPVSKDWQKEQGLEIVQRHIAQYPDHGVGISNANALDFDVTDEEICNLLERKVNDLHPNYLKRIGLPPKFLVIIHPDSDIQRKSKRTWHDGDHKQEIEILHKHQQQFVAYGEHPDTREPYTWFGSDPYATPLAKLAVWTQKDIYLLLAYFDTICEQRGFKQEIKGPDNPKIPAGSDADVAMWAWMAENVPQYAKNTAPDNMFTEMPPETMPIPTLVAYLKALPMEYCDDRDNWFRMGGIIYDLTGGSEEGFQVFDQWSRQSEKYDKTPGDTTRLKWRGYKTKPGNSGVGTLMHWVDKEGIKLNFSPAQPAGDGQAAAEPLAADAPTAGAFNMPTLLKLNGMLQRFVLVESDSRVGDKVKKTTLSLKSFKDAMAPNFTVEEGPRGGQRRIKTADQWLASKSRVSVDDVGYFPSDHMPIIHNWRGDECFNVYRPTALPYIEVPDMAILAPFMSHVEFLVPSAQARQIIWNWTALNVQKPWIKPFAILLITPNVGLGKNILFEMYRKILGLSNVKRVSEEMLKDSNQFNDFLADVSMLLWDEVKVKTLGYNKLKTWVTDHLQQINGKYGKMRQEMTYNSSLMFSNHNDAIQIEDQDDRRLYVSTCTAERRGPDYYTKMFKNILDNDLVAAHFLALMRQRDISKFDPHNPPMTEEKKQMMVYSQADSTIMIEDLIEAEQGPCMFDIVTPGLIYYMLQGEDGAPTSIRSTGVHLAKIKPEKLDVKEFRVPVRGGPMELNVTRPRNLVCLRNYDKWKHAPAVAVRLEFLRAREAARNAALGREAVISEVQKWA